jgi:hypothetical protein
VRGTIAIDMRDPEDAYQHYEAVVRLAAMQGNIPAFRGCLCDPGTAEAALPHTHATIAECLRQAGSVLDLARYRDCLNRCGETM